MDLKGLGRRRLAGLALIVFGLLCVTNVIGFVRLATVNYIDIWKFLYPGSEDSSSPDVLTAGSTINLIADLYYQDESSGWSSDPYGWTVYVEIYDGETLVSSVTLTLTNDFGDWAEWSAQWTVPDAENVLYTFVWNVITPDSGSTSKTTYGKTPLIEPDGVFKVNGEDASESTTLHVISPVLIFEFVPSRAVDKISGVYVEVWKGGNKIATVTLVDDGGSLYRIT